MCFILPAFRRNERWTWICAGLSCAAAFLYSKESGILPALCVFMLLAIEMQHDQQSAWRSLRFFLGGISMAMIPFLLWLGGTGGLGFLMCDLWHPAVLPYTSTWSKPLPALAGPLKYIMLHPFLFYSPQGAAVRWWFPLIFFAVVFIWSFYRTGIWPVRRLRILALFGLLYFMIALGRSDFDHWLKATPDYWLLLVAVVELAWITRRETPVDHRTWTSWITGVILACLLWPIAFEGFSLAWPIDLPTWKWSELRYPHAPESPDLARLGPRSISPAERVRLAGVVERIHRWAKPGEYTYLFCDDPAFYFLADVINPTRYATLVFIISPEMESEVIKNLDQHPPRCIVGGMVRRTKLVIPRTGKEIARYIQLHYDPVETFGGFVFYRPKGLRADGKDIIASAAENALIV